MISDRERKKIAQLQTEENLNICVNAAATSANPHFLQQYAISYNWDDGYAVARAISDNKVCDLGTALTLFWLAEAMCFYTGEQEKNEYNKDWTDFCSMITERLINGHYNVGPTSFKPELAKTNKYKYMKLGVPAVLYEEVKGIP